MPASFNLFELLDLDPGPPEPDGATIRQSLGARIETWNRDQVQGNPKQQRLAKRNLERRAEIEAVAGDSRLLKEHAAEARTRRKEARKAAIVELDDAIEILRSSGQYDEKALDRLVKQLGVLSRAEIEKRLKAAGISLRNAERRKRSSGPEPLDRKAMAEISGLLEILEQENLYEFLDLRPQSSTRALQDKAKQIYQDNIRRGRTDARSTAASELAGKSQSQVFADDESRARYDAALALVALQDLRPNLDLAGEDRVITSAELDKLVEIARRRGVEAEVAIDFIVDYAEKKKWVVQSEDTLPAEALQRCGFCLELNEADSERCRQCGEALELACPRCGESTPSSASACTRCGCRTGDAPMVRDLLTRGRRLLATGQLVEAKAAFEEALVLWPDWQPAVETLAELNRRAKELDEARAAIEALIDQSRIGAARSRLESAVGQLGGEAFEGLKARIDPEMERAERHFAEARAHLGAGRTEQGLSSLEACLGICADHGPAAKLLARHPPSAPSRLAISELAGGFRLEWSPAPGRISGYRVVRKAGGRPHHADDGQCIARVSGRSADDVEVEPGKAWFYAVFSERSGIPSVAGAVQGPYRRLVGVSEISATAGDRRVDLSWTRPPGCREVEVVRLPCEGVSKREWRMAGESLADEGLRNGVSHRYQVTALFPPFEKGEEERSAKRLVEVVPEAPAPPVLDLEVVRNGRKITATWTPIDGARVELRRSGPTDSSAGGSLPEGLVVSEARLEELGVRLAGSELGHLEDRLPGPGIFRFVPLTRGRGQAVVGRAVTVTSVDPVADLRHRMTSGDLALQWRWPRGIDQVRICWDYQRPVESPREHQGPQETLTRSAYERQGYWRLPNPEAAMHYFSVFAESAEGAFSEARRLVATLGHEVAVRYRLVRERSGWRRRLSGVFLEMVAEETVALPRLMVVAKEGKVPLSAKDGKRVADHPAGPLEKDRPARIEIPSEAWIPSSCFKLFLHESSEATGFRLLPAPRRELELS